MIIEKEKSECVDSLFTGLTKTHRWRKKLTDQYTDTRNANAAEKLAQLAEQAPTLSDAYWEILKPHFNDPVRWRDCLSRATRQVGFVHKTTSFPFFVRNLIALLSESEA